MNHSFNLTSNVVQGHASTSPAGDLIQSPAFPFAATKNPAVHPLCRIWSLRELKERAHRLACRQPEAAVQLILAVNRALRLPAAASQFEIVAGKLVCRCPVCEFKRAQVKEAV